MRITRSLFPHLLAAGLSLLFASKSLAAAFAVTDSASAVTAMHNARYGDVVTLYSATFDAALFAPDSSGRPDAHIRFVSKTGVPDSTILNGPITFSKSYISLSGVKARGRVTFGQCAGDSFFDSKVDSGGLRLAGLSPGTALGGDTSNTCYGHVVSNVTFQVNKDSVDYSWYLWDVSDCTFSKVRMFSVRTDDGNRDHNPRGRYLYYSRRNHFIDTRLDIDYSNDHNPNNERFALCLRDFTMYNEFTRDTLWNGLRFRRSAAAYLSAPGNPGRQTEGNRWNSCDYRSWDHSFSITDTLGLNGGSVMFSVIAASRVPALFFGADVTPYWPATVGTTFRNNTVYTESPQAIFFDKLSPASSWFSGNVIVCRPTNAACVHVGESGCYVGHQPTYSWSDSNYFAPSVIWKVASEWNTPCCTLAQWRSANGNTNDMHSVAGAFTGGMFVDARWKTLNLRPSPCSPLTSASAPGGHWGALARTSSCN